MEMQIALFVSLHRLSCLLINWHEVFEIHVFNFILIWLLGHANGWYWIWVRPGRWCFRNARRLVFLRSYTNRYRTQLFLHYINPLIGNDLRKQLLDIVLIRFVHHAHGLIQFVFQGSTCFQRWSQCRGLPEPLNTLFSRFIHSFFHLEEIIVCWHDRGLAAGCIGH